MMVGVAELPGTPVTGTSVVEKAVAAVSAHAQAVRAAQDASAAIKAALATAAQPAAEPGTAKA